MYNAQAFGFEHCVLSIVHLDCYLSMLYSDRPFNFAHRGASYVAPANTLAAFLLAAELGADGIELDVHLSSDGEVVVIHDFSLDATTDGYGPVRAKTLAELKELDAGRWFDPTFAGQRIPTLQQVIDAVGHRLFLNIELKSQSFRDEGLVVEVVRIVEDSQLIERVVISSFNPWALWRVKRLNPRIPVGLLYSPEEPLLLRGSWSRHLIRPEALHPEHTMVDGKYMRWAKEQGYRVHVWTVDEPADMEQLMRDGVDIMITNRPDLLHQMLTGGVRATNPSGLPRSSEGR
jgi:glycerophosphoryl diester phosphodiesterase